MSLIPRLVSRPIISFYCLTHTHTQTHTHTHTHIYIYIYIYIYHACVIYSLNIHTNFIQIYAITFYFPLIHFHQKVNPLRPNDPYRGRTAPLNSKLCILYIYSTNIGTEYFKHGIYSPFFSLQNAVCFIIIRNSPDPPR